MLTSLFPQAHTRYTTLPVLGGSLEGLCAWLVNLGYPLSAVRRRIEGAPLLDKCLQQRDIHSLTGCTATQLRACFPRQKRWTAQIAYSLGRSLMTYLEEQGVLTAPPPTPSERLLDAYCHHLGRVRGLAPSRIRLHWSYCAQFLRFLRYDVNVQCLSEVRIGVLEAFLTETANRLGRITMQTVVATLRSFLRFLTLSGIVPAGLDRQLESPRHYRDERFIRALSWDDVISLLNTVNRSTVKGTRDYAMLLLIATYGLRISEVASLQLEDIQWRARVIRVPRPKIGTPLDMPLTDEVATALLEYLRHRKSEESERHVFLRVRVPRGPIQPYAVAEAFYFWSERANVHPPGLGGPHCLRHALAMHLLRQGTSIKTIGDLLGHRNPESTGIYLRLPVQDLHDVALPLPITAVGPEVMA